MLRNKDHLSLYLFYLTWYIGCAIQTSFFNLYLNSHGVSSSMVGVINGIVQLTSLLFSFLIGMTADRAKNKNTVLIFGLILSCITLFIFDHIDTPLWLSIFTIVFLSINNPLLGLYESITVSITSANNWKYSPIRMTGTISYAFAALIAGLFLVNDDSYLFKLYLLSMIANTVCGFLLPKVRNEKIASNTDNKKLYMLLKNKKIFNVLYLFFIYSLGSTINSTYFGIYMNELGGNYRLVGIAQMLLALSEIPFHIGPGARWFKKIGIEKSMLVMVLVGSIRWLIVGFGKDPYILMISMLLNGIMLVPTIVGLVEFIHEEAPEELRSSAQTSLKFFFQIAAQLIVNIFGGLAVGYIDGLGLSGIRCLYLLLSPLCLLSFLVIRKRI